MRVQATTSTPLKHGIREVKLSSWELFSGVVRSFHEHKDYVFRGQSCSNWPLESTLDRLERKGKKIDRRIHFEQFLRAIRGRRGPNPPYPSDHNDLWALGQHFGLATPLLDWTTSPFIAAFFAFAQEDQPDQTEFRIVYALSEDAVCRKMTESKLYGLKGVDFIRPYSDENPRLINQGGLFTRSPDNVDIESWVRNNFEENAAEIVVEKILIPTKDREVCLRDLNTMNVNHLTLFPDLTGASLYCNMRLSVTHY